MQVDTMDPSLSNSTPMDPLNRTDSPQSTVTTFLPVLFGTSTAV